LVTYQRTHLFGHIIDGTMILNDFGNIIMSEWEASRALRPHMHFDTIMVMPDHVHMLVYMKHNMVYVPDVSLRVRARLPKSISSFVAQFKATCTRTIRHTHNDTTPVWQRDYDDQRPRNKRHVHNVRRYIRDNPRNAPPTLFYNRAYQSSP